ncbi:MAG: transglutaminase family protein [Cyanobacteriota bacterium]|nr:transglutaminase family protein [Cyanobacteriota bacterium]
MDGTIEGTAARLEDTLVAAGICLTLGGEPTLVPDDPDGAEWSVAADGPTKLRYARALAAQLQQRAWPNSTVIFCPGKRYDGEINPRWALRLINASDGQPLLPWPAAAGAMVSAPDSGAIASMLHSIGLVLGVVLHPLELVDPLDPQRQAWAVPLAWDAMRWQTLDWDLDPSRRQLSRASGPAGLRLPLQHFPEGALRQVLTIERDRQGWGLFLPPVPREPFEQLLQAIATACAGYALPELSGVLPLDTEGHWQVLGLTADPGVLEINLPVCHTWQQYADWLRLLEQGGAAVGLRSIKQQQGERSTGTGGGNHLLLGVPSLEQHPFFGRPAWLVGLLRYWHQHPSLSYLFSGNSVGPASQAPRCDEGSSSLLDLELAHRLLEQLPAGDHRVAIGETLRHLHADRSGNTHRSEISLDKFWNPAWSAGCQGLLEFRAIETMPDHRWSAVVALLVRALAVMLLDPKRRPAGIRDWGPQLHDRALLPSQLWADLEAVLSDLEQAGLPLPAQEFRAIWSWRFPRLLHWQQGEAELEIRLALEPWPLLCDVPVEGGNTSRFVDSSLRRFELIGNGALQRSHRLLVDGRPLPWPPAGEPVALRYRQEALFPCLHPLLPVQLPLRLDLLPQASSTPIASWLLQQPERGFEPIDTAAAWGGVGLETAPQLRPSAPGLCTLDLRF